MDFLGIGDLHFTSAAGRGGLSPYIKDYDQMIVREVSRVLKYARKQGIKHIVQYGDICEEPRASYSALLAMLEMFALGDYEWHVILGNHDKFAEDSAVGHSLQIIQRLNLKNVHIYEEPKTVKLGKASLNMLPWPHTEWSKESLNVAHVDVAGAVMDSGRPTKSSVKHRGKSVIGHIHTHQVVGGAHYSGTLFQTNFGEAPEKFFHHVTYDGGYEINSIPFKPEYRLTTLEVASKKDLAQIENDPKHLYKLKVLKGSAIANAAYGSNVVLVSPAKTGDEAPDLSEASAGAAVEFDPDEFFDSWIERQTVTPELRKAAIQLRKETLNAK